MRMRVTGLTERDVKELVRDLVETAIEYSNGQMSSAALEMHMYLEDHQIVALKRWLGE